VEVDIETMKKYVQYCRSRCAPRLSAEGAAILQNQYVQIRSEVRVRQAETGDEEAVPITVRQLEALIRLSESLAKMTLAHEAGVDHVNEAIRLFKCSTMSACGSGSGMVTADGGMRPDVRKEVETVEEHLARRIMIGSNANTLQLQEEFKSRGFSDYGIKKAIDVMVLRGEFKFLNNKRMLKRLK
jgi:DNA replication licensing factor MCM5